ncbi:peptide deformylase [Geminocystis herdmanii]|uniref:peptide deformylase n=1 Tax=Geminocystis herdmanii TaxID=669359 RepID=UPI000349DBD5|nr:peptide deformylase [Geminocystis herdmanii]
MTKEILLIGNPVLRITAKEVTNIDNPKIQTLIDDLLKITYQRHGVGISAPQIGESSRVIIVASHANIRYPDAPFLPPMAMINPRIVSHSEDVVIREEGCLSVENQRGDVPRYKDIMVEYFDRAGNHQRKEYNNFVARIIQHELDHLNGILFVDRLQE